MINKQETSIYTMETRVRYSTCGADRQTRLSDILDYFQDTCTFQAEELGVGLTYMHTHQTAWVLNSWQADLFVIRVLERRFGLQRGLMIFMVF